MLGSENPEASLPGEILTDDEWWAGSQVHRGAGPGSPPWPTSMNRPRRRSVISPRGSSRWPAAPASPAATSSSRTSRRGIRPGPHPPQRDQHDSRLHPNLGLRKALGSHRPPPTWTSATAWPNSPSTATSPVRLHLLAHPNPQAPDPNPSPQTAATQAPPRVPRRRPPPGSPLAEVPQIQPLMGRNLQAPPAS